MFSAAARTFGSRYAKAASLKIVSSQRPVLISWRAASSKTFLDANDVAERIMTVVKNFEKVDSSKVTPKAKFNEDLGLDSLDTVEVVMAIEDEFAVEIPDAEADKISSIEEAINYIALHPMAK